MPSEVGRNAFFILFLASRGPVFCKNDPFKRLFQASRSRIGDQPLVKHKRKTWLFRCSPALGSLRSGCGQVGRNAHFFEPLPRAIMRADGGEFSA